MTISFMLLLKIASVKMLNKKLDQKVVQYEKNKKNSCWY